MSRNSFEKKSSAKKVKKKLPSRSRLTNGNDSAYDPSDWADRDEALLIYALEDKIHALDRQIEECESPNAKNRLKDRKKTYRNMIDKVYAGNYGSTRLYKELKKVGIKPPKGNGKESSYDQMDFRFDEYFLKTRYYGISLPLINVVLIVIVAVVLMLGMILPSYTIEDISASTGGLNIVSLYSFKLGPESLDYVVVNDGEFPQGSYAEGYEKLYEPYVPVGSSTAPGTVRLYDDLGMLTMDVSLADIIKGVAQIKPLSAYDLTFIKDNEAINGADAFYARFIFEKNEYLEIKKNADGEYDKENVLYSLAVYLTLYSYIGILICLACGLVSSVTSLFTYTGRRLHFYAVMLIIFSAIAMIMPAFLAIPYGLESDYCLSNYFSMTLDAFLSNEYAVVSVNIPVILTLAVGVILLLLPKIFRNRAQKLPGFVPAGNRPPTPGPVKRPKQQPRAAVPTSFVIGQMPYGAPKSPKNNGKK